MGNWVGLCAELAQSHTHTHIHTHSNEHIILYWYGGSQSEARQKVPYQPGLELGICGVRIYYTIRSPTAGSSMV